LLLIHFGGLPCPFLAAPSTHAPLMRLNRFSV
jgi:hypothetical protein